MGTSGLPDIYTRGLRVQALKTKYSTRLCLVLYLSLAHSFTCHIFHIALAAML